MAKEAVIQVFDDLTGDHLSEHETITFGVDGKTYEFDTSPKNAEEFRKHISKYVDVARTVRGRKSGNPSSPPRSLFSELDQTSRAAFREWAQKEQNVSPFGLEPLNTRGRVADAYVEAWRSKSKPAFSDQ